MLGSYVVLKICNLHAQVHNIRSKMVSVLREKFAHLNLTFSIGGQISFDVSDILLDNMVISYCSKSMETDFNFDHSTGFPSRLGQNILPKIH